MTAIAIDSSNEPAPFNPHPANQHAKHRRAGRPRSLTPDQIRQVAAMVDQGKALPTKERRRLCLDMRAIGRRFHISWETVRRIHKGLAFSDVTGIEKKR